MNITTRTTRAELAEIVEVVPLEMVVASEIVAQLKRLNAYSGSRSAMDRRRLAINMALQYLKMQTL